MSLRALNRVSKRRLVTVRVARFSVAAIIAFSGLIGVQKFTMAAEGDLSYDRTIALVPTACSSGSDFDSAGNIYVIDWCEHKVYKFTSSGTPILDWGGNGSAAGEFSNPQDILVGSDDRIYITDYSNARVQIFDTNGVYIDEYGSYGTGLGQFQGPNYIAEAPDGTLYVSESSTHTIEQFSKSGTPINEFGSFGTAEGQFRSPGGLAFGPDDNLYVGDWNNKRVQVFTASGAFIRAFGVPVNANGPGAFWDITGIDFDDDGRLYVGDGTQGRIQVFDSGGAYAGDFGSQGTGSGQFDYLTNLTIHNGEVYASDSTARLQVIDIDKEDPYVRAASVDLFSAGYGPEGWNGNGYTMTEQAFPTKVQLPDGVTPEKVEVGQGYSAVIGSDDKLYVFGQNVDGQLGQGNTTNQTTPVEFPLPGGATAVDVEISALTYNIFVLASDGQVYGAGNNTDGRLGAGLGSLTSDVPVRFQLPVGVDAQSVHYDEFLNPYVITTDGDVYTAGTGNRGQLGNGLFANQSTPVKVDLPVGVTATGKIVSYEGYTALLASDGNAYAFGQNTDGQLGIGTNIDTATPTAIPLPGGVTATDIVASHDQYNIFIRTSDDQFSFQVGSMSRS